MKIGGFPKGVGIIARRPVAVVVAAVERDPEDTGVVEHDPGRQPIDDVQERDPDDAPEMKTPLAPPDRPMPFLVLHRRSMTPEEYREYCATGAMPKLPAAPPTSARPDVTRPVPFKPAALPTRSGPPQRPMPPGQTPTAQVTARPGVARARPVVPASALAAPTPVTVRAGVRQPETEHVHPDGRKLKASDIPY